VLARLQALQSQRIKHLTQEEKNQGLHLLNAVLALPIGSERDSRARELLGEVVVSLGGLSNPDFNQKTVALMQQRNKARAPKKKPAPINELTQLIKEQRSDIWGDK
jgi:hypothetical protein